MTDCISCTRRHKEFVIFFILGIEDNLHYYPSDSPILQKKKKKKFPVLLRLFLYSEHGYLVELKHHNKPKILFSQVFIGRM